MNAVAVCPDGNELRVLPSGRSLLTLYFIPFTAMDMIPAENASAPSQ